MTILATERLDFVPCNAECARAFRRVSCPLEVDVTPVGGRGLQGLRTLDVSASGMFVITNDAFEEGTEVLLEMGTSESPLWLSATVVRAVAPQDAMGRGLHAGMGVHFNGIDSSQWAQLAALVEKAKADELEGELFYLPPPDESDAAIMDLDDELRTRSQLSRAIIGGKHHEAWHLAKALTLARPDETQWRLQMHLHAGHALRETDPTSAARHYRQVLGMDPAHTEAIEGVRGLAPEQDAQPVRWAERVRQWLAS